MNATRNILFAAVVGLTPVTTTTTAHAVSPNFPTAAVMHINAEGFRACKAMGNSGHTAVIRGILGDGGGNIRSAGYHTFNIRTCFQTSSQCNYFLDRIHHKVSQIEQINYSRCSSRG